MPAVSTRRETAVASNACWSPAAAGRTGGVLLGAVVDADHSTSSDTVTPATAMEAKLAQSDDELEGVGAQR